MMKNKKKLTVLIDYKTIMNHGVIKTYKTQYNSGLLQSMREILWHWTRYNIVDNFDFIY